jgi:lysine-specific demethylase 8
MFKSLSSSIKCRLNIAHLNNTRKNSNYSDQYPEVVSVCMSEHLQKSYWTEIYEKNKPILIKGLVNDWRAVSDNQLKWITGVRFDQIDKECLVPIEIGRNYMDKKLSIVHVGFGEFSQYMLPSADNKDASTTEDNHESNKNNENRVFLAQYSLQEIPLLEDDVKPFPAIIQTGKGSLYRTNIWMGGEGGTESPCHYDPFHNIICQVYGKKEVILYSREENVNLYPAYGTVQKNTSLVDFISPDIVEHPLFSKAKGVRAVLEPGDGLYIPKGYWHYCTSKAASCSVNFWWL